MRSRKKDRTFPRVYLWLAILAIGSWWVVMVGVGVTYLIVASTGWSRGEYRQADSIECKKVASRYGIEVVTPEGEVSIRYQFGTIRAFAADQEEIDRFAPALSEELGIYPLDLVQKSQLRRIVLCTNLTLKSAPVSGLPDFQRNLLFLDVRILADDPMYARKAIHHELFHMIDFREDGVVDTDTSWMALNPPGFQYGDGGFSAVRDTETMVLTDRYPGFLNHYSTTSIEEDKAEMFSHMIKNPEYVQFRAMKDPIIQAKVSRMKVLLQSFCPTVDKAFWDRVESMNRQQH